LTELGFSGAFSTVRLYRALKIQSLVRSLISVRRRTGTR